MRDLGKQFGKNSDRPQLRPPMQAGKATDGWLTIITARPVNRPQLRLRLLKARVGLRLREGSRSHFAGPQHTSHPSSYLHQTHTTPHPPGEAAAAAPHEPLPPALQQGSKCPTLEESFPTKRFKLSTFILHIPVYSNIAFSPAPTTPQLFCKLTPHLVRFVGAGHLH